MSFVAVHYRAMVQMEADKGLPILCNSKIQEVFSVSKRQCIIPHGYKVVSDWILNVMLLGNCIL